MNPKQTLQTFFASITAAIIIACCVLQTPALAARDFVVINRTSGKPIPLVIAEPLGQTGRSATALQEEITSNLSLMPFLEILDRRGIPGSGNVGAASGQGLNFSPFKLAGAQLLVTTNWTNSKQVEIRVFEVTEEKFVFGNRYTVPGGSKGILETADTFCGDLLEQLIGRGDFFHSKIAFSKSGGKYKRDIWAVKPNGRDLQRLTNMPGEAISPTWSTDGRFIVFTHIDKRTHGLGIWDNINKSVQRIKFPGNTVIGPCFMPDNRVAVSLSDGRNPSIYLLNHVFQRERKLDQSTAIDVSPSIDASGTKMVFTSDRLGNPHIFLKDLRTGGTSRISLNGKYNTDPAISPDGTVVAFSRLMPGGHRIFVYDLISKEEKQITFGPGSDEMADFSPDSYFIVFMSTRSGQPELYFTTRDGGTPKLVPTGKGDASFPAWGKKKK